MDNIVLINFHLSKHHYYNYIYICDHQSSGKGKLREILSQNATDVYMTCASVFPQIMHTVRQTTRAPVLATKIPV